MTIVLPYPVCHSVASVGRWSTAAPIPEPSSTTTDTNAALEKRGTQTTRPAVRRATGRLDQRTSSPMSPPTQSAPEARWSQSRTSASVRGDVCAAWPAAPGTSSSAPAASSAPHRERRPATDRRARSGRSSQIAAAAARVKSANRSSKRRYPRPKAETSMSGTSAPIDQKERNANCAVASNT